ncbi:hypothetical protein C0995_001945 [Termitomyces sp. Mi166|nr:hypothetical protein C0995_001945 [Termitomyces sp. Mi166\
MGGVEYYSYGFYDILLQDLVSHLAPRALIIPQFRLSALIIELDEGNLSDSDSIVTTPQKIPSELFPDFAVILMHAIFVDGGQPIAASVFHQEFEPWGKIKIECLSVCILAEAKRWPTQSAPDKYCFRKNLKLCMDLAIDNLEWQAKATFVAYSGTHQLILIAFAGKWSCWWLVKWTDYGIKHLPKEKTTDDDTEMPSAYAEISYSAVQPHVLLNDMSNTSQSNRLPHHTTRNTNPTYTSFTRNFRVR